PYPAPVTTDYARLLGGEVTGFVSSAAPTTIGIPLHDPAGSTIALLNPTSGAVTNSFTYEPFGTGTVTGPATSFPFRFKGMEFDGAPSLYHAGTSYYSPKLQRSISGPGNGGGGAGGSRPLGSSSLPPDSGSPFSPAGNAQNLGISVGAGTGAALATVGGLALFTEMSMTEILNVAGPVGTAVAVAMNLALFLDDLFSSGSSEINRKLVTPAHGPFGIKQYGGVGDDEAVDQED